MKRLREDFEHQFESLGYLLRIHYYGQNLIIVNLLVISQKKLLKNTLKAKKENDNN